jgi:diadenosine tetraphosphate (Ap4A) HIT family hydrolase
MLGMIEKFEDTPFEQSEHLQLQNEYYYAIYEDKWPVCDGHLLFIPKQNNIKFITLTLEATVEHGDKLRSNGEIDAYHFGMNMGEAAGQTVMWPHVHFIPRHKNDVDGFPGSVRLSHTGGKGANYYAQHPKFKDEYIEKHSQLMKERGFK